MRILLVGINYAPELIGIAPYTTELAEHLADQGHAVHAITGVPHYPEWRRMPVPYPNGRTNPMVKRYAHYVPRRANALGRMLYETSWLASAARGVLSTPCDIVLGIVPSLSGGMLAVMAGRRWRVPVGLIVQDLMGPAAAQSGYRGGGAVAGITASVEGFVLRSADRVATISDGFRPYLDRAGVPAARIYPVRDWTHPGKPTESAAACRARLGWKPTDFVCLHAGNMGKKQGLDTVLDAANLVAGTDVRIVLAGDGNDRERLVARARESNLRNVSFLALQPPGQYEAMLRAADVLIVNQRGSVIEMSLPSKLAGYFAAGRPVIAAAALDCETAREVRRSSAGLVVPPDDPLALAESIVQLKTSPEAASLYAANGVAYAEANLTPRAALPRYDELVSQLFNGHSDQTGYESVSYPLEIQKETGKILSSNRK